MKITKVLIEAVRRAELNYHHCTRIQPGEFRPTPDAVIQGNAPGKLCEHTGALRRAAILFAALSCLSLATPAAAACYHDGDVVTLDGVTSFGAIGMPTGTTKSGWILSMSKSVCASDVSREWNISRVRIIGTPPPNGAYLILRGTLSLAGDAAIKVISGRFGEQTPPVAAKPDPNPAQQPLFTDEEKHALAIVQNRAAIAKQPDQCFAMLSPAALFSYETFQAYYAALRVVCRIDPVHAGQVVKELARESREKQQDRAEAPR